MNPFERDAHWEHRNEESNDGIGGAFQGFERLKRRLSGKKTHTGFAPVGS